METFSIVDKINVGKLNTKIAEFVYKEGYAPYIFMNNLTWQSLYEPYRDNTFQKWNGSSYYHGHTGLIGKYQGYKMFEDNTLEFGEIELR